MSTHLHAVPARQIADPSQWFWSGGNPADAPPPRVLCAEVVRRLASINAVVRALRSLGVRILEQHIEGPYPANGDPMVRIERDPARPFGPVLDAMGRRAYIAMSDRTLGCARIDGVVITWEEPR